MRPMLTTRVRKLLVAGLTLGAALLIGLLLYGPVARHPGSYLFRPALDGIKNYYTAIWYVLYDHGLRFTGMNYPFGELSVFTDNQPLLTSLLGALHRAGYRLDPVAVLNAAMLLGQLVGVLPLLGVLRRCRLPDWYAAPLAVLIQLLTPQLERLLGHYALSYSGAIPLLWYVSLRAFEVSANRWALGWWALYALIVGGLGWLHPYYLLIGALLLGANLAVAWWQRRRAPARAPGFWLAALAALMGPLVAFQGALAVADPYAAGRPTEPYGFFAYSASVWSVFLPIDPPVAGWTRALLHTPEPAWEGHAYGGLVATVVAGGTLWRLAGRLYRRQWRRLRWPALPLPLRVGGWAGLLILLFAMGWPFRWGLEGLLDLLGPIQQFRSIGRFAWIFYYFFAVFTAHALYQAFRWTRQRGQPARAAVGLAAALALWASEAVFHSKITADRIRLSPRAAVPLPAAFTEPTHFRQRLARGAHQASDFQAIVPLPFYCTGSEKISRERSDFSGYPSMRAALETGLPLVATMLSRTALAQALTTTQLLSDPALDKPLLALLPDRRPLLVVRAARGRLDAAEARLLRRATVFYRDTAVWLAELPLTGHEARPALLADYAARRAANHLTTTATYQASSAASDVVHRDFDDQPGVRGDYPAPGARPLLGAGAVSVRRDDYVLFDGLLPRAGLYEASVWTWFGTKGSPTLRWRTYDHAGHPRDSALAETKTAVDFYGEWARLALPVPVRWPGQRVRVYCTGRHYLLDAFEQRPDTVTVWRRTGGALLRNNFPLLPAPPLRPGVSPTLGAGARRDGARRP